MKTQTIISDQEKQDIIKAMRDLTSHYNKSTLGKHLLDLVYFRISQINSCAYCIDMHSKELRHEGEPEQRLYLLSVWREASSFYTAKERAALSWAESVNAIKDGWIADAAYEEVREQLTEKEIAELTLVVIAINGYNRINIAFGANVGSYEVG